MFININFQNLSIYQDISANYITQYAHLKCQQKEVPTLHMSVTLSL